MLKFCTKNQEKMVLKSQIADSRPAEEFADSLSAFFFHQLDKFAQNVLILDHASGRQWTGAQLKVASANVARKLVALAKLEPNDDCVFFYKNSDHIHLAALGVLFAGGSVCAGSPYDPEPEHAYMIKQMRPRLVFVARKLRHEMLKIRESSGIHFGIVIMDDNQDDQEDDEPAAQATGVEIWRFHDQLMAASDSTLELPIRVRPDRPAFVLLTSGSTGHPKPVGRSHRNSLYVCHSLDGAEHLWELGEQSVMAGHLQLDHGTGTFCLKMTLAKGLKLVVMDGYRFETMLEAIEGHQITDCLLGSALLHNFMNSPRELEGRNLGSLRNLIAIGSPIASHSLACQFMDLHPNCSVRQAFGLTECGFITFVERSRAREDSETVGKLLPNLTVKLLDRESQRELGEFERDGELLVSGPTIASGYLGAQFEAQSREAFLADGFYRTNDICSIQPNGNLLIKGRFSEVLCLHDGWKVLPAEIEALLVTHPLIREAVVVGVPHPELPTCHAPRAYIVPRHGSSELSQANGSAGGAGNRSEPALSEKEVFDFVAARMSEPKHLVGGVKFVDEFPRISVGKVDKKLLKKMDGFV